MNRIKMSIYLLVIIAVVLVFVAVTFFNVGQTKAQVGSGHAVTVRWLLAHQPTSVFDKATKVFAETLSSEGDNIALEVVTANDLGFTKGDVPNTAVMDQLSSGKVQMASAYTVALGKTDSALLALTLPYVFSDYSQLPAVLDGKIGKRLLNTLDESALGVRGLAFTLSGGFRIIASKNKAIHSVSDLKGLHIATSGGPVAEATLKSFGAVPVSTDLESGSRSFDAKTIDGIETTYSRLAEVLGDKTEYTKFINETNHSMFLTAIIVNKEFFDSLSEQNQKAMRDAALAAAQVERLDSIALGGDVKSELAARGSIMNLVSADDTKAFISAAQPVAGQFKSVIGADIMEEISAIR